MMAVTPSREHIPIGRENAITSEELAVLWGMTERDVRRTIATMRITPTDDPFAIMSEDGYPGFWRSNLIMELEGMVKRSRAKAIHTYASSADARRALGNTEYTEVLGDA